MIILDATTKSLQFKLAGAITTNQLPFAASYIDTTGSATTPGEQDGVSNNTTAVTVVGSPASSTQRLIKNIIIQNADTASATVTVIYNNNSTLRNIIVAALAVGDQLIYEDGSGWTTVTSNGSIKTSTGVTSVSVVSANGLAGTVANATTTPAITLSTSVTGVLKGNGTAISAAAAGTDYQGPITLTTTGTSGAATFSSNTLNIPQYSGGGLSVAGRLTLTSVTPVLTSTVTGAGTIYFTPYLGNQIPIYNGTSFIGTSFSELSQALTDTTHSPAAAAANSVYDLFVWNNSGTLVVSRGPAWSSSTSRGTGAGTTQLSLTQGFYTNTVAITNGPGAGYGTYVGTIATNGSSTVDFNLGGTASGGTAASIGLWNYYNRIQYATKTQDSKSSWTYATFTWRAADNSTAMRATYVAGMSEDLIEARYTCQATNPANGGQGSLIGIAQDATNTFSGQAAEIGEFGSVAANTYAVQLTAQVELASGLGQHYMQAVEIAQTGQTTTFYGVSASQNIQNNSFIVKGRY